MYFKKIFTFGVTRLSTFHFQPGLDRRGIYFVIFYRNFSVRLGRRVNSDKVRTFALGGISNLVGPSL